MGDGFLTGNPDDFWSFLAQVLAVVGSESEAPPDSHDDEMRTQQY